VARWRRQRTKVSLLLRQLGNLRLELCDFFGGVTGGLGALGAAWRGLEEKYINIWPEENGDCRLTPLSFAYSSWVWIRSRMRENVLVRTRERKSVKPVR
jgi:hypothetical protein